MEHHRQEMGPESVPLVASRRSVLQGAALSLAGIMTGSGATFRRASADEAPRVEANGTGEAPRPFQGLFKNEGHAYHNWGLSHETKPAVYVEPISYADVQRVVVDPLRFSHAGERCRRADVGDQDGRQRRRRASLHAQAQRDPRG